MTNSCAQNGQVRCLFLVGCDWQLLFKRFKALFEMCSTILFKLVVNFPRSRSYRRWTSQCAALKLKNKRKSQNHFISSNDCCHYLLLLELMVLRRPVKADVGIGSALKVDCIGISRWSSSDILLSISRSSPLTALWFRLDVVLLLTYPLDSALKFKLVCDSSML